MKHAREYLAAGALLPPRLRIKSDIPADPVSARIYNHPALGDRPVVRLTPDKLAKGDDLEMDFFGFSRTTVKKRVAKQKRQTLGFPGWALINDPKHAKYALKVVRRLKRAARKAKSKPGQALEMFLEIAEELGRGVPAFLPSYWEEVGRIFIRLGNTTYGARAFGKAREVEKVHALDASLEEQGAAFVEFALSGSLTIKSLTQYGRDLQESVSPRVAWEQFRDICIRRTLGGLPPWAAMARDLRGQMKAAGVDVKREEKTFLKAVLESPAIARAPESFWRDYSKTIADLIPDDPRLGRRLLALFPEVGDQCFVMTWLDHLDEWGLLENLDRKNRGPKDGIVPWLNTLFKQLGESRERVDPSPLLLGLLEKNTGAIKKEGRPLVLAPGRWRQEVVDLDALEYCLRLDIEVDATGRNYSINLCEWAGLVETDPGRLLDPKSTSVHPVFGRALTAAVGDAIGNENFEKASMGKPVMQKLRKEWLLKTVSALSEEGIARAERVGRLLAEKTDAQIYKENPEAYALLREQKIADALQTTLKGGILDEFGWPGLEEAALKIDPDGKKKINTGKCAPFAVLSNGGQAVVAGPGGIVFEHDLKTPAGYRFEEAFYIDGDLLVIFEKEYSHKAYWAANPDDLFDFVYYSFLFLDAEYVQWRRDDGCFFGDRLVRSGSPVDKIELDDYFTDGEHVWKFDYDLVKDVEVIFEYDFRTRKRGRPGMPTFFEDFITVNRKLDPSDSWLYAPGDHASSSPLGGKDGLVGWRVGLEKEGDEIRRVCEGIDGRRTAIEHGGRVRRPQGLMSWPGAETHRLIGSSGHRRFSISSADGSVEYSEPGESFLHRMGQPFHLPTPFWHNFKPRDPDASKILRSISEKACAALLAAAIKEFPDRIVKTSEPARGHFTEEKWPETLQAVHNLFPHKPHPRLVAGILGVVQHAAIVDRRLEKLKKKVTPDPDRKAPDEALRIALEKGLVLATRNTLSHCRSNARRLFWLMAIVNHDFDAVKVKESYFFVTVTMARTMPLHILPRLFEGESLDLLADFLEAWVRTGIAAAAERIRLTDATASAAFKPPFPVEDLSWEGHMGGGEVDGRFYVLHTRNPKTDAWRLFEFSPEGVFKDLPGLKGHNDEPLGAPWSPSDYEDIARLIRQKGRPPISMDALKGFAESTGLSHAEASLLWCGFPGGGASEKDFLSKPLRERLELKVNESYIARENLSHLGGEKLESVVLDMLDREPPGMETADAETPDFVMKDIWSPDNGRYAARLARIWNKVMGEDLKLPVDLYEKIRKELDPSISLYQLAEWISDDASPLHSDYDWKFALSSRRRIVNGVIPSDPGATDGNYGEWVKILDNASALIPFLFDSLPVGDSLRELVPRLFDLTLARLSHPGLLIFVGTRFEWTETEAIESLIRRFSAAGANTRRVSEGKTRGVVYETEAILGIHVENAFSIAFRPALVTSEQDKAFLLGPGRLDSTRIWRRVEFFLSGRLKAFCNRIVDTPAPDGGWENNPLLSAPEVVDRAAASLDLDREAAALYLQHLALAAPTRKNILLWNGWKPAMYKKRLTQLCKKKLLLEAKRKRAGRNHFLPGGWEDLKAPLLPLETWKLPLFELKRNDDGKLIGPYIRPGEHSWETTTAILPVLPSHELFARAWWRVEEGDPPRYEDVS